MTTITAKVIEASYTNYSPPLVTVQLRYPRFIHAELMTHRVFSRNASSSRAIPVPRLIADIKRDTAMPIHWGKNQKGMQADEECNNPVILGYDTWGAELGTREDAWMMARDKAIDVAEKFHDAGYHKQIVNRLLEPFSHINVLVTSTDWRNWFMLRDHKDAMPEIQKLAQEMHTAINTYEDWRFLPYGSWHMPYISDEERMYNSNEKLLKMSSARCARVSYLTHEQKQPTIEEDLALYKRLMLSDIKHASPTEHQAKPDVANIYTDEADVEHVTSHVNPALHGNFRGWIQHRKLIPGECFHDKNSQFDIPNR